MMSTHYEGDPCDNTKKFYKWMREQRKIKNNKELLKGVKFTVFGLGDSSYEQYNYMGKYTNESMEELGAERIYKYGEGNAEGNHTEDDFNLWKANLWPQLIQYYASRQTEQEKQETKDVVEQTNESVKEAAASGAVAKSVEYPLAVELLGESDEYKHDQEPQYEMAAKQYLSAKDLPIKHIVQLRQNLDEGSTLEVSYDLKDSGMTYETAANLAVFPENSLEDVEKCARRLGYSLTQRFALKTNPNSTKKGVAKHPFPTPTSVKEALIKFVDLQGPVRKRVLKDLSAYAKDENEKQR